MKKETFETWLLKGALESDREFESAHIDELDLPEEYRGRGLHLVGACGALLERGRVLLNAAPNARRIRFLMVFLPLQSSLNLSLWTDELWEHVGTENEPPTLYLMARDQILHEWDEDYRRPLDVPVSECPHVQALYRCWRTRNDMQHSWEFERGIFLALDLQRHS
jgi:hypothetical protein